MSGWRGAVGGIGGWLSVLGFRFSGKEPAGRAPVGAGFARELFAIRERPKLAGRARFHSVLLALLLLCGNAVAIATENRPPTTENRDLIESVAARIQPAPVLRGEFVQARTLAGFSKPLRSSGSFVAARGRGVLWTTLAPFAGELVITENAIRERIDGSDSVVVDASREPALRQVNRILLAVLQGELATLREQFSVAGTVDPAGWQLTLEPQGQLAELIGRIELGGSDQVEAVAIFEHNGDVSRVEFSALATAESLSAAEAARFD